MPRSFYLPKDVRDTEPVNPEGTDLAIWTYESNGRYYAVAFQGRAQKPLWDHVFRSEAYRDEYITKTITERKRQLAVKQERQQERREWQHGFQKGDILYTSWGYDQTNVDYYQVVDVIGKVIVIREIESRVARTERTAVYVVPSPGHFKGPPMRKMPTGKGTEVGSVRISSYSWARKWDGEPKYQTAFGYGH